ncbi:hypothetical protein GCM10027046_15830 [Uliginosibacterium flavum]|uniref:Uncharacterized protein n=1 Tax=Uliginosibacterium flavum TaxID=1396831 RepID=A0ABV2TN36_9RHOO
MKDFFRTMFGIRKKRAGLRASGAPQAGASIVRNGIKITLTQACDRDLWDWLLLSGWRVNPVSNDRRHYASPPETAVMQLLNARTEERTEAHARVLRSAR